MPLQVSRWDSVSDIGMQHNAYDTVVVLLLFFCDGLQIVFLRHSLLCDLTLALHIVVCQKKHINYIIIT